MVGADPDPETDCTMICAAPPRGANHFARTPELDGVGNLGRSVSCRRTKAGAAFWRQYFTVASASRRNSGLAHAARHDEARGSVG